MSTLHRRAVLTGSAHSSLVSQWTQRGFIKSIQRGTITLTGVSTNTATVTVVDVNNATLRWLGQTYNTAADFASQAFIRIDLTNATTVTATAGNTASTGTVNFELVEYVPGILKSVQRGTIAVATTATATVTAVTVAKTQVDQLGWSTNQGAASSAAVASVVLTNATTVTATAVIGTQTIGYQVAEFY